jgi:nucleoside 2-deoxyribosyltransferase
MDQVEAGHMEVTHDWTSFEETYGDGTNLQQLREKIGRWQDLHDDIRTATDQQRYGMYAMFDIEGVRDADAVIMIIDQPDYEYRGTFTELGAALVSGKPVTIVGPDKVHASTNVFYWHPDIKHRVTTWREALSIAYTQRRLWTTSQELQIAAVGLAILLSYFR